MSGPLEGLKIIEMVGIGPTPFCAMMLADMGAEVIRIDRSGAFDASGVAGTRFDVLARGRRSLSLNLKKEGAKEIVLQLISQADALIEGFRPGVMEKMGLGPDVCLEANEKLVYGRMTGWGQDGPLSHTAGHDINYIALTGVLNSIGSDGGPPQAPVNYLGDFGGGGMLLAFGVMCALNETSRSGKGQVVDAAMAEGASVLSAMIWGYKSAGFWKPERGTNIIDGGAHFYGTYMCADGKYIAIGAVEPQFYSIFIEKAGLSDSAFDLQMDAKHWPKLKVKIAEIFLTKTQNEWCSLLEGSDACFTPVLDWDTAPEHPHNVARKAFVKIDDVIQPSPVPKFSRTSPDCPQAAVLSGTNTLDILNDWGISEGSIQQLQENGAI